MFENLQSFGIQKSATGQVEPSGICAAQCISSGPQNVGHTFQQSPTWLGTQPIGAPQGSSGFGQAVGQGISSSLHSGCAGHSA